MKTNQVSSFLYYMFNAWSQSEAITIFGNNLGRHVYDQYQRNNGNIMIWYSDLDYDCRDLLVKRAVALYDSHGNEL
jgi:hypothetical protein